MNAFSLIIHLQEPLIQRVSMIMYKREMTDEEIQKCADLLAEMIPGVMTEVMGAPFKEEAAE